MKRLLRFLTKYRIQCILAPLFKMLEASFELIVPLVIADLIDRGIGNGDQGYIYRQVGILGLLALVGFTVSVTAQYFAARAAIGFAKDVRHELFGHLLDLSYENIDSLGINTMITRITSDVNLTQNGVNMFLRLFLRSPFVVFGAMVMAFTIDAKAALVFVATILGLSIVVVTIMSVNIPALKVVQNRLDDLTGHIRENLIGVRVIRAFRREDREIEDFSHINGELTGKLKSTGRVSALMNPLTYILINLGICVLIYVGAIRVEAGALTGGQVVALYNYMSQILVELIKLANLVVTINRALAGADRIADALDIEPAMVYGTQAGDMTGDISVRFQDAALRYSGASENSAEHITFQGQKGETIGIIGGTGSGKTSIINLLTRNYDATEGHVYIGDRDIRELTREELLSSIGVVRQKAVMFAGTVRENLLMGVKQATDEELMEAVKNAQALDVVESKGGLDGIIEQGGRNLSGGQRQRLSIARILAMKTPILVLDDSSSALDYKTDLELRRALTRLDYKPLVFIISQRTSSLMHADRIVVMDDGRIAGIGSHEELMETCDIYREIHNSQIKREE